MKIQNITETGINKGTVEIELCENCWETFPWESDGIDVVTLSTSSTSNLVHFNEKAEEVMEEIEIEISEHLYN